MRLLIPITKDMMTIRITIRMDKIMEILLNSQTIKILKILWLKFSKRFMIRNGCQEEDPSGKNRRKSLLIPMIKKLFKLKDKNTERRSKNTPSIKLAEKYHKIHLSTHRNKLTVKISSLKIQLFSEYWQNGANNSYKNFKKKITSQKELNQSFWKILIR